MIHIDFQGGAHGNYLEFVCNKMAGLTVGTPFNAKGASHAKQYTGQKKFYADHYSTSFIPFEFAKIISIRIEVEDLLPIQQISLLRANDHVYDNDQLEINTYHKLNVAPYYQQVLNTIVEKFFTTQIKDSYNAVKDPSWPSVSTLKEFENLPDWIKQECIEQHNLQLLEISSDQPDCPRSILREFFQLGFLHPEQHGFIVAQQKIKYAESKQVYIFPFKCFYIKSNFLKEIKRVADWAELQYNQWEDIEQLHDEFLQKQPFKDSKIHCDKIVDTIKLDNTKNISKVNLIEEAYINARLGWNYFV